MKAKLMNTSGGVKTEQAPITLLSKEECVYFIGVFDKKTNEFLDFVSFVRTENFVWDTCGVPLRWKKTSTAQKWADKINQHALMLDCRVVTIKEVEKIGVSDEKEL